MPKTAAPKASALPKAGVKGLETVLEPALGNNVGFGQPEPIRVKL